MKARVTGVWTEKHQQAVENFRMIVAERLYREQVERETKITNGEATPINDQWAQEAVERRLG